MNVKPRKKRMFGACILLMMAILAVYVMVYAAAEESSSDSYSLVILKVFAENTPDDVLAQAKERTYTFKIEGTKKGEGGTYEPFEPKTITLSQKDGWSYKEIFGVPYNVTVTEITDNIELKVLESDGKTHYYNMSDSHTDAAIPVNSRTHELELKNNSRLIISRPEGSDGPELLCYRVTNRLEDGHASPTFEQLDTVFFLRAGEEMEIKSLPSGNLLCAGIYTVEQIAAPDGYQLQMGTRNADVDPGNTGHFYINGTPGQLTLTAGGTKGDGAARYYTVERTEEEGDETPFEKRTVKIASGEDCVLDNLPKGGYVVTEYSTTENANTAFSVTTPQTTKNRREALSSAPQHTQSTGFRTFTLTEGTTYIKLDSFGPLYDSNTSNRKVISDPNIAYILDYGVGNENGGITYSTRKGPYKSNFTYTPNNPPKCYPKTLKIGFRTRNVNNSAAKYLGVVWTEYFQKEVTTNYENAGVQYKNITVDDRGWMTITAPTAKEGAADQIVYYYTLRDSENNVITGAGGTTDKSGTTVMLKAGEIIKLEGLTAGSYKITETVEWQHVGFSMKVNGMPFGTAEAGKKIEVKVGGERALTISKPALLFTEKGAVDNQDYTFEVTGSGLSEKVILKAGESKTITLPQEGTYTVTPTGDQTLPQYNLNYTDSGAVYGTAGAVSTTASRMNTAARIATGGNATITFENVFTEGEYGYRYVHEYYVKESDGTYTYEGNSQITTRLGRTGGESYIAGDITKVTGFQGRQYAHFDEAYGWVDGLAKAGAQADPVLEVPANLDGQLPPDAGNGEPEIPKEDPAEPSGGEEEEPEVPPAGEETDPPAGEETDPPSDEGTPVEPSGEEKNPETPPAGEGTNPPAGEETDPPSGEETPAEPSAGEGDSTALPGGEETNPENPPSGDAGTDTLSSLFFSNGDFDVERDSNGIVSKGTGSDSGGNPLNYGPEEGENEIEVTEDASRIIILRYYRDRQPLGNYKVIHVYYLRDEKGDRWEGVSEVLDREGELGSTHTGNEVEKEYVFQPKNAEQPYTYTWDNRPQYGVLEKSEDTGYQGPYNPDNPKNEFAGEGQIYRPDNAWTAAEVTKDGNQIIILRYYREPAKEGSYKIVHEYYFQEKSESQDGTEEGSEDAGIHPEERSSANESGIQPLDGGSGGFSGTLNRDDGYFYTFEGRTEMESVSAPLGSPHAAENVEHKTNYQNREYTYIDAGYGQAFDDRGSSYSCNPHQQWATATAEGNEVIILRYCRKVDPPKDPEDPPKEPEDPPENPEDPPKNPEDPPKEPEDPPKNPEDPPKEPEDPPKEPENPPYVPDTPSSPKDPPKNPETPPENPENPPEDPEVPTEDPETPPENPEVPSEDPEIPSENLEVPPEEPEPSSGNPELPDPNDPNSPDTITILEDGVPKTYVRVWDPESEEWEWIPEDEIPLAGLDVPQTGDENRIALWMALTASSLCGLFSLRTSSRKRREKI